MEVTPHVETSLIETIPECRTSIRFEPLRSSTTHPIKHRQMTLPAALSLCRSVNSTLAPTGRPRQDAPGTQSAFDRNDGTLQYLPSPRRCVERNNGTDSEEG